jgi:hypothetical protein
MRLLWDSPGQTAKLAFHVFDLAARGFALLATHLRGSGARQAPGTVSSGPLAW